jgi:hypothetical protein
VVPAARAKFADGGGIAPAELLVLRPSVLDTLILEAL